MIRRLQLASRSTSWPSRCRPACRSWSIFPMSPSTCSICYGTKGPTALSPRTACRAPAGRAGVRFIQLYHRDWDHMAASRTRFAGIAKEVDQACAALSDRPEEPRHAAGHTDCLDGEFGRTPMASRQRPRHHMKGFSGWLCGQRIRGGITYGATDDLGYNAVETSSKFTIFTPRSSYLLGIEHDRSPTAGKAAISGSRM